MKKFALFFVAALAMGGGTVWGQGPPPSGIDPGVPVIPAAQSANIAAGTVISGQLDSQLDLRTAKVGDQVVLRTDREVKFDKDLIAKKGARLIGHVAEVRQRANGDADSSLGIVFDRLDNGTTQIPLSASITSVLLPGANADVNSVAVSGFSDTAMGTSSGVVNATGQKVGNTVRSTGSTNIPGLHIVPLTSGEVHGGSSLSIANDNLTLEKGTTMVVLVD